jgi:hypothetical protein
MDRALPRHADLQRVFDAILVASNTMNTTAEVVTRRRWLHSAACGFGGVALHGLMAGLARA